MQDFIDDPNPTAVFHAARELGAPEYVKSAHVLCRNDVAGLRDVAFADRARRMFPVHTKAACWLSAACWYGGSHTDSVVENSIKQAATAHGIEQDVSRLAELFAPIKSASSPLESTYALTVDFQGAHGLQKQSFYLLDDPVAITDSGWLIDRDISDGRLTREVAQVACRALVKAAREHNVDFNELPPRVTGIGEDRLPDFDNLRHEMERRKQAGITTDDYATVIEGAEAEYNASDWNDRATCLDKWASLWLDLDSLNGADHRTFMDPFSALYSGEKLAAFEERANASVFVDDVLVPGVVFALLNENQVRARFNKEAAAKVLATRDLCASSEAYGYEASSRVASLNSDERKELLQLLLDA